MLSFKQFNNALSLGLMIGFILTLFIGCNSRFEQDTRDTELRQQENTLINDLQQRKNDVVDEPNLTDFRPADMFARTLEEQDKGVRAFAYFWSDFQGKFVYVCEAAAFPYPGGTQFTSPTKQALAVFDGVRSDIGYYTNIGVVDQADPNGLYTPATAAATIAPCWAQNDDVNNTGNGFEATYWEESINVVPNKIPDALVLNPDTPLVD